MFSLRRTAFRLLSTPYFSVSTKPRSFSTISPSILRHNNTCLNSKFQRRFASDATTQAEPEADGATEAQHGDNSIAASTGESALEPPSSSTAAPPEPTEDGKIAEPADQQEQSTVASALSSAANTASTKTREAASDAAAAVTDAGETVADTARDLSSSALDNAVGRSSTPVPTVYIGNLFFDVTEETLRREMGRFGDINMIRLIVDSRGLSKGFAYVEFKDQISADRCIEEMNQQIFEGRRISVQYTIKKENRPPRLTEKHAPTRTLFIGNMSFEMSDQDLNDLFREIRNVIDVRVAIDRRTGQPRGFAHADFVDVASAEEAMKQLDGKEIYGRRLRLDFSENPSRARTST